MRGFAIVAALIKGLMLKVTSVFIISCWLVRYSTDTNPFEDIFGNCGQGGRTYHQEAGRRGGSRSYLLLPMTYGVLLTAYDFLSEKMTYALARSIGRWNMPLPVWVLGLGCVCGLDWRGLAQVRTVRAAGAHHTDERWFNKLGALLESPFDETLYLDSDMVVMSDVRAWTDYLRTDDFTFFNVLLRPEDGPDEMLVNVANPHRMKEHYGLEATRVIESGGHFFFRKTSRGVRLVEHTVEIMQEALEHGARSLYGRIAGQGNIPASDEIAACLVAVEENIALPPPVLGTHRPIGIYMTPYQSQGRFDFDAGIAEYHDNWRGGPVTAGAMHFCSQTPSHPPSHDPPTLSQCRPRKQIPIRHGNSPRRRTHPRSRPYLRLLAPGQSAKLRCQKNLGTAERIPIVLQTENPPSKPTAFH